MPMNENVTKRAAGNWISSYLKLNEDHESPRLFHQWMAIGTIAAVLRRNVYMESSGKRKKNSGRYCLYPNFYVVLVSPPGTCRKGAAIGFANEFLKHIEGLNIYRDKITPEGLITELKEHERFASGLELTATRKEVEQLAASIKKIPKEEHDDPDVEQAKQQLLAGVREIKAQEEKMKSGLDELVSEMTILVPELSTMFGVASYVHDLRVFLTSLYDNKPEDEYTTKGTRKVQIYNANVNMLGASNPAWLATSFADDSFGGGFMSRIIFVYQEKEQKKVPLPEKNDEQIELEENLVTDLKHISTLQGAFKMTEAAVEYYCDWYRSHKPERGTRMSGYHARKHIHLLKLAMVLSVAHSDNLIMEESHCKIALALLEQLEAWLPDAFAYIGATNEAQLRQRLLELIQSRGGFIKVQDALRHVQRDIRGKRDFFAIMETLVEMGDVTSVKGKYYVLQNFWDHFASDALDSIKAQGGYISVQSTLEAFGEDEIKKEKFLSLMDVLVTNGDVLLKTRKNDADKQYYVLADMYEELVKRAQAVQQEQEKAGDQQ